MRLPEGLQRMRAAVVGAGAWGTAFACVLAARGHDVALAAPGPVQARAIEETGRNPRYLPNVELEGISATTVGDPSLAGADLHVIAVPSRAFAEVVRALPGAAPVLSLTKGLDPESGGRLSKLVERRGFAVLSGPNFAEEIGDGLPAAAVIASEDAGLAGMGDLIVTCWSRLGRNRHAGELIAQGAAPDEAAAQIGTVEGLTTAPVLRELSHRVGVELPITEGVCQVLDGQDLYELAGN